jgi:hypothetical protein
MKNVNNYLRDHDRIYKRQAVALIFVRFLANLFIDVVRVIVFCWIRLSGRGKTILFASNDNHLINVKKYIPQLSDRLQVVRIKNSRSILSVPQSILGLNALYQILITKNYNYPYLSHLDIDNATYENSEGYFRLVLKFLKCDLVILSREDINPFTKLGLAAQSLSLNLIVFEHGPFTRSYISFKATEKTMHVYSSEEGINKRTPIAQTIYKFNSPLYDVRNSIAEQRLKNIKEPIQILVGDTFNIRTHLIQLAEGIEPFGSVKIRLHPGYEQDCGKFSDHRSKVISMSNARLIVTGISGLALESAFCGISTLIIVTPEDEWAMQYLDIFEGLSHVRIVTLTEFIMAPRLYMNVGSAQEDQLTAFQVRMGFENEDNTLPQIVRDLLQES